jgi:thiol-disulfide isomerase/thioredoxin
VRHYEGILRGQGFTPLGLCHAPCKAAESRYDWRALLDPTQSLDSNYIPTKPTVTLYYRDDALVVIAVGTFIDKYSTLVKTVQGRIVDRLHLDAAIARQRAQQQASATPPALPDPVPGTPLPPLGGNVEVVVGSALSDVIAGTKGYAIVQLTSLDKGCPHCVRSNPSFESLARNRAGTGRFIRAQWSPYASAFEEPFLQNYAVSGLPTFIVFKDGRPVRRLNGNHPVDELDKKLIQGL